ncbi:MAG: hypothetical protein HYV63_19235 [Candidatus Schekmanbacteria bacterium]|nr:hypothetical protein [Candidatus Schekmanbacteria bacterium]
MAVPIELGSAGGLVLHSMDIWITYDVLALRPVRHERSILATGLQIVHNIDIIDASPGALKLSILSPNLELPIELIGRGRFLDAVFEVLPGAVGNTEYPVDFERFKAFILIDDAPVAIEMEVAPGAYYASDAYRRGDLDGDADLTSADALSALVIASGRSQATEEQLTAGDVDGDGRITAGDVIGVQRLSVGLPIDPPDARPAGTRHAEPSRYQVTVQRSTCRGEDQVEIAIELADAGGVAGVQLELGWTSEALSLVGVVGNTSFTVQSNAVGTAVQVVLSRTEPLPTGPALVAVLTFAVDEADFAAQGRADLVLGKLALYGEYGNDLSWTEPVTAVDGWVVASADGVPVGEGLAAALLVLVVAVVAGRVSRRSLGLSGGVR